MDLPTRNANANANANGSGQVPNSVNRVESKLDRHLLQLKRPYGHTGSAARKDETHNSSPTAYYLPHTTCYLLQPAGLKGGD